MSCNCSDPKPGDEVDFQYAGAFVCGIIPSTNASRPLPHGNYFTKFEVHNPSRCDCITFRWKVAVGLQHHRVGPISDFSELTLCPDEALEIDTSDIFEKLGGGNQGHKEGFVVFESPSELDVVAFYGAAESTGGGIESLSMERIKPRTLPKCGDFSLDISTGKAAWKVKGPQATDSFSNPTLSSTLLNWPTLPNSSMPSCLWLVPGNEEFAGDYTYRLCFSLCTGFKDPMLVLHILAEYSGTVKLNGHIIPITPNTLTDGNSTPTVISNSLYFKSGENCLEVIVNSKENKVPTGLAISGSINVKNGLCSGTPMPVLPCPTISYRVYTSDRYDNNEGWEDPVANGATAGNRSGVHRIEEVQMWLAGAPPGTKVEYTVYQEDNGWLSAGNGGWFQEGQPAGSGDDSDLRLECIKIRLINSLCSICYKVFVGGGPTHSHPIGWTGTVNNGDEAGTTGHNRRMEQIQITIC